MIFTKSLRHSLVVLTILLNVAFCQRNTNLTSISVSTSDLTLIIGETEKIFLTLDAPITQEVKINFTANHHDLINITPEVVNVPANQSYQFNISVEGQIPGHVDVSGTAEPSGIIDDFNLFFRIIIANSRAIIYISTTVGWIYFVAWSVSFYPQMIINYKRKSVVGLSFDFLALNFMGHTLYAIFNACLYYAPFFQEEYFRRFPRGTNPVELNDVFFSIHASFITALTIIQCFIYERGEQRVSDISRGILGIFFTILIVITTLSAFGTLHWLDWLNTCSYIKLAITLIKYIPQAVLNYRRKSTVGWSIGNILLDFTGGMLSMLQMILNSYNYNDWQSIFGDPTKFGLGLFSVLFDILFIIQHYVLYSKGRLPEDSSRADLTHVPPSEKTQRF